MSRFAATLAIAGAFAITSMAHAQQPAPGAGRPPRGAPMGAPMGAPSMDVASRFLAQTGELKLTDQQVTRLAAIARRAAEHRQLMRASLDSLRPTRFGPPGLRDQAHADLRDALAVLTPDQLATAWGMMSRRGGTGAPGGPGGRSFRPAQMRPMPRGR